jgi:hypothetical protein
LLTADARSSRDVVVFDEDAMLRHARLESSTGRCSRGYPGQWTSLATYFLLKPVHPDIVLRLIPSPHHPRRDRI